MELKKPERLEEGWVKFTRYYCKEGHIDCWNGDMINNPNNPTKGQWQLNAFTQFFRYNNGKWINSRDLRATQGLLSMVDEFTAEEIWNEALRIEAQRQGITVNELKEKLENEID